MIRSAGLSLLLLCAAALPGCGGEPPSTEATATARKPLPLTIVTAGGARRFAVEVARTDAEQQQGLMHRTVIAPDGGMLFPFATDRIASFWMRDTLVPLDMIFIRADGTIARIAANTVPLSLEPVDSGVPVQAVLEIAGGRASALGIAAGDRVVWRK